MGTGVQELGSFFTALSGCKQRDESEVEQLELYPAPIWNDSIAGSSLMHYTTTPGPRAQFCNILYSNTKGIPYSEGLGTFL